MPSLRLEQSAYYPVDRTANYQDGKNTKLVLCIWMSSLTRASAFGIEAKNGDNIVPNAPPQMTKDRRLCAFVFEITRPNGEWY